MIYKDQDVLKKSSSNSSLSGSNHLSLFNSKNKSKRTAPQTDRKQNQQMDSMSLSMKSNSTIKISEMLQQPLVKHNPVFVYKEDKNNFKPTH